MIGFFFSNENSTLDSNRTTTELVTSMNQTFTSGMTSLSSTLLPDLDGSDGGQTFENPEESDGSAVLNPEEKLNLEQSLKSSTSSESQTRPMRHKKFKRKPNQTFEGTGFFDPRPDGALTPKFQSNQNDEEIKDLGSLIEKWNPDFWDGQDDSADDDQQHLLDDLDKSEPNRKDRDMFGTELPEMRKSTSSTEIPTTPDIVSNLKIKSETDDVDLEPTSNETNSTADSVVNDNANLNTTIDLKEEQNNQTNSYQQSIQQLARQIWVCLN